MRRRPVAVEKPTIKQKVAKAKKKGGSQNKKPAAKKAVKKGG
jgi:hypothetical protein